MSDQARVRNEQVFRAANESVQSNRTPVAGELLTFLCECSSLDCTQDVEMTLAEYTSIRRHARQFAVEPGHEDLAMELVLDEFDRYTIVVQDAT